MFQCCRPILESDNFIFQRLFLRLKTCIYLRLELRLKLIDLKLNRRLASDDLRLSIHTKYLRTSLEKLVRSSVQGYCDVDTSPILEQFQLTVEALFERVQNDDRRVLRSLMPPKTEHSYNLRRRRHDYELITKTSTLNTNHFLIRMLDNY